MNPSRRAGASDPLAWISPAQFSWGLTALLALLVTAFHQDLLQYNREPEVVLSEILAVNHSALDDADGDFPGWIELQNRSGRPVDLAGWHLTDDFRNPTRWTFPSVTLDPGAFLVVFASGKDRTNRVEDLHANFRLDPKGRFLGLARPGGGVFEDEFQPKYPALPGDVSFGRLQSRGDSPFPLRRHGLFVTPSPGETNRGEMLGQVADTQFSHPRGIHDQPFMLTIGCRTPGSEIRYTLDGSLPRPDRGVVYSGPIAITNTTILRAAAFRVGFRPSNVDTLTFLFPAGARPVPETSSLSEETRIRTHPLPPRTTLSSVPIVSLVLDPADLWDPTRGLQVNPLQTGDAWEKAASMEWIESGFTGSRTGDRAAFCGLSVHGSSGGNFGPDTKLSFRLVFRDLHGTPEWSGRLFGPTGAKHFKTLLLDAGSPVGESMDTRQAGPNLIRGALTRETFRAMGQPAPDGRFVHVVLNGSYWGVYDLQERIDTRFLADRLGGKPSNYTMRSPNGVASREDTAWLRIRELCGLGMSDPGRYAELESLVDLEAFADFVVLRTQDRSRGDFDAPGWIAVRRESPRVGAYLFLPQGRHLRKGEDEERTPLDTLSPTTLYRLLQSQPRFMSLLEKRRRMHESPGGALSPAAMEARRSELLERVEPALGAEMLQ
ncbi:MAG: hypothetical protein FJ379_00165 [Verrucomicrobia bacterium]|nr:hypothetical protein [Verrucomicrobiota bacterium]